MGAVARWVWVSALVICGLGLLDSAYLTYEHYSAAKSFACPATGAIDCVAVTTSKWSTFLGMPVAPLGLAFFAGMTLLCLPKAWQNVQLGYLRLAGAVLGVVMALYLVWAEVVKIHKICLYCTGVHVLCLALLLVVLIGDTFREPADASA